jgi:uncharacterized membrane protein
MGEQENSNSVYHIVAFTFPGKDRAAEVMSSAKLDAKAAGLKIVASAVVEVNDKGKTHIHQPGRGGLGTTAGLITGGLLGLVGGPAGLLVWAAGGALLGGVAGKYLGRNLPEEPLRELAQQMEPNTSAILIIAQDKNAEAVIDEMKGYNAKIITLTVGDQVSGEIAQYVAAEVSAPEEAAAAAPAVDSTATPAPAASGAEAKSA